MHSKDENVIDKPKKIEELSFKLIRKELLKNNSIIKNENMKTILRIIHATADFEYAGITEIHPKAIKNGMDAIKNGCRIYADTKMIQAGINSNRLKEYGTEVYTYISDHEIINKAKEQGITRSIVGIEKACNDPDTKIFVIGNAPTALFTLKEQIELSKVKPDLIVGVPVGFVGASESKEEIKKTGIPYIVTNGRKGGSTVAVAIMNSIIYQIEN